MRSLILLGVSAAPLTHAQAQWSTTYEQFYLPAAHNWVFRSQYASADRLFNAFDFGHAILYETLWTKPQAPSSELEVRRYRQLTEKILVNPPRLPLEEAAIEPKYAQLAPEAKVMFDWAHLLHRQLYDVLADERLDWPTRDAEVARLVRYYRSRRDLAFSSQPKTMRLMQEQPYSLAFRKGYPKFNGLIWGYHWLQMGLYEPFMVGRSVPEKQSLVRATVARFFQMLQDAPRTLPHQMPMTVAVAPTFAARYPEAAIIFDNLHSMHDVVSDILANPAVPRPRKRAEILKAARAYRDDTTEVMSIAAWRSMSLHMGLENMGGAPVGFLPALPTPTVTAGAVMQHDVATGAMTGFGYGGPENAAANASPGAVMDHAAMGHVMPPVDAPARTWSDDEAQLARALRREAVYARDVASVLASRGRIPALRDAGARLADAKRSLVAALEAWIDARGIDRRADDGVGAPLTPTADALRQAATDDVTVQAVRALEQSIARMQTLMKTRLSALATTTMAPQDAALAELLKSVPTTLAAEAARLTALRTAPPGR